MKPSAPVTATVDRVLLLSPRQCLPVRIEDQPERETACLEGPRAGLRMALS
jgi:hypothetical protein